MTDRPELDKDGKIPCILCNQRWGPNHDCKLCEGTGMCLAPPDYKSNKQLEEEQARKEERRYDIFQEGRKEKSLEERLKDIEEVLYEAGFTIPR